MKPHSHQTFSYHRSNWTRLLVSVGWLASAALLGRDVLAADVTWTGGTAGTGTTWLAGTNWSTGSVPGSTDNAIFASINALPTSIKLDMSANGGIQQVGSITLSANLTTPNFNLQDLSTTVSGTLLLNGANGILLSNASGNAELIIETNINGTPGGNQGLSLTLGGSGAIYAAGNGDVVSSVDPGRVEIYSSIGETNGPKTVTLSGPGNVLLRNVNSYSGGTFVANGALELDALGTPGTGPIYLTGGSIQCDGTRNGYSTGQAWIPNAIVVSSNAYIFNVASTANSTRYMAFSGPLSGTNGSLIICNPTTVSGNTFWPRFAGSFTFNLPVVIADTTGDAFSDNSADFSAIDMCNSNTSPPQIWNGVISSIGIVRRSSPILNNSTPGGSSILTANNTYSGGTIIASGTIFANNTAGSALGSGNVTVTNQGVLAGNGAVIATTSIYGGGLIQPGSTSSNIANLAVSSLTLGTNAGYTWQIGSATGTPGTAWDLVTCSSGWTDAGSSTSPITVYVTSKGITPTNWNAASSYTWMIIANSGAATGFNPANWTVNSTGFSGPLAGVFAVTNDSNGDLLLTYTPTSGSYLINVASGSVTQGAVSPTAYPLLSGLYNVTKIGNGEVIMTNSLNSYQGATYIDAGTVSAAVNSTLAGGAFGASSSALVLGYTNGSSNATLNIDQPGVSVANAITVQSGSTGTLTIGTTVANGLATYSGSVSLLTNVTLSAPNTSTDIFSGNFSGAGGVSLLGGGTIVMSGTGSYSGPTSVTNLSLDLNGAALGTNTFTINSGVALDNTSGAIVTLNNSPMVWNSSFGFTGTTNLNLGTGTATLTTNCTITVNANVLGIQGPITGTGFGFTKAGAGEISLLATTNSTYTGGTTNLAGILGINDQATFGNGTGPLVLAGGILRSTASRTLAISNPVQVTVTTRISGDSVSTPPSTRVLPFAGAFTVVSGATVIVDNSGLASNTFALQLQGSNNPIVGWPIQLGDATYDTAGSYTALNLYNDNTTPAQTVTGLITGTGFIQRGAANLNTGGTTILSAQNTFSGGVNLNSGAIGFGVSSVTSGGSVVSGPLGTGYLTIGANNGESSLTIFPYGGARTIDNHIVLNGIANTIITGSNNLTLTAPFNTGGVAKTLTVLNTGITTISGPITNAGASAGGALTKAGSGELIFTGVNTYPGTTTVTAGTLLINGNSSGLTNAFTITGGIFGGNGSIGGPVTYASGAEAYLYKTAGSADSPLTLETNLTLSANTVIVDLGGTTTLGAGTYTLLTYAGTLSGSFAPTPVFVNGSLASGYAGTISTATPGVVSLVVTAAAAPLKIGQETVNGNQLVLSGTGGSAGTSYHIVTSTNVTLALTNWTTLTSGTFAANGGFTNSLTINTNESKRFYRLKTP